MKYFMALILTASILSAKAQTDVLTPESLWQLGRVSEPAISPDGNNALYTVRAFDVAANKGNTDIYIISLQTGTAKAIANSAKDEADARFMNNTKISFTMDDEGGNAQVWTLNADGSEKAQVTFIEGGINNYGVAANGTSLWFTHNVKLDKSPAEIYPDLPKTEGARIIDGLLYRHWNTWSDYTYSHLFVAPFKPGIKLTEATDVMPDEKYDTPLKPDLDGGEISWDPTGTRIAYTCRKLHGTAEALSTNSDIYIYDMMTHTTINVSAPNKGYDRNPRFSPDGKQLLWLSMEHDGYESDKNRLVVYDLSSKTLIDLTAHYDNDISSAEWNHDGTLIYATGNINGTDQVIEVYTDPTNKQPVHQLTNVVGDIQNISFTHTGNKTIMIASMMSISRPTELFKVDVSTGKLTPLTHVNDDFFSKHTMGKVEGRWITTTDNKKMLTWVITPPHFDATKKYPTLLYCQGGPQSTVSQFWSYRWNFQLMAAKGYIIVAPNRRGLPGFGRKWNDDIKGEWGGQCMNDYLSAIDTLSKEPYVDKDNLGCVGASFGGYSVFYLAGNHQNRFKAFIAHCGVFNLESMYGTTEETWFNNHDFDGQYWKSPKPKSYDKYNPIKYVQNWNTPILIIANEKDYRVPKEQGMEAFTAAQVRGIPSRLFYLPDEGHWVTKPQNSILWQRVYFDWLDRYLKH